MMGATADQLDSIAAEVIATVSGLAPRHRLADGWLFARQNSLEGNSHLFPLFCTAGSQ